ncbi:amino acid ABC transporter permease [Paraburkholderia rhizosphaerae]|uniref:Amino acid ABC transporter membrane protein 2 (PAAT family) n=1 Tax=Paraburkholderia rhizosphaerae TaxID=480658 RepID=A0A4R8LWC8_9BURK|nr:amino acid ABC transporter permease [Paraburkholderia rhizosphaerae]TDY51006.1 amino acid ABC transporter membrane protein 2 (PAAT family) [Paraburkholderia rhizosphaerae]
MIATDWFPTLRYLLLGAFPDGPLGGAALTVAMSIVSALLSSVLGLAGGIALMMTGGGVRLACVSIVGFFRAIPVLMLVFWAFFLMPVLLHIDVPGLATVICALALIGGAYMSHSVHAGLAAVGAGQWQAAASLGMTRWQALRYVVMRQALQMMAPSFVNQWVALVKDTSLAYIVGVPEFTFLATQVNNRLMVYPVQIFLFVGAVYLLLCSVLQFGANRLLPVNPNTTRTGQANEAREGMEGG